MFRVTTQWADSTAETVEEFPYADMWGINGSNISYEHARNNAIIALAQAENRLHETGKAGRAFLTIDIPRAPQ